MMMIASNSHARTGENSVKKRGEGLADQKRGARGADLKTISFWTNNKYGPKGGKGALVRAPPPYVRHWKRGEVKREYKII